MLFMKSQIIYSCPSCFRFGLRLFHSVSRLIPHLQIINLRCYTVVAGEPDVVTSEVSERRERPSFTLLSLHSCRSSCRHSSSNPHGMNECSERVTWGEGGREVMGLATLVPSSLTITSLSHPALHPHPFHSSPFTTPSGSVGDR